MEFLQKDLKELTAFIRKSANGLNKIVFFEKFEDSALEEKLEEHKVRF